MAAEVERHEAELVGQCALVLLGPAEVVLRPAVDEQDRRPVGVPPLPDVELQAPSAAHCVGLRRHVSPPSIGSTRLCPRESRRASGRGPYLRPRGAYLRDMFVGRARELEQLEGALAGSGATVLVTGEAGIGKTRLVSELAARCECEVLLGRAIDLVGTELPYQPFVEALGELPRETGSQLRVFETALGRLTARAPVLLVLEDLHWADASTLDLVVFLAHNLHDRRVLLVGTCRDGRARAPAGRRRPAVRLGARARARAARPRRADRAARRIRAGDRRPVGGQPVLRPGAARRGRRALA